MFFRHSIDKMFAVELDEARRNNMAQSKRVHEIRVVLAQAEAALEVYTRRVMELSAIEARNAKDAA